MSPTSSVLRDPNIFILRGPSMGWPPDCRWCIKPRFVTNLSIWNAKHSPYRRIRSFNWDWKWQNSIFNGKYKKALFYLRIIHSVVFQSMQEDCCSFVSCLSVTLPEYKRSYKTLHIRDYVTTFLQRLPQLSGLKAGRKNGRVLISQQKAHWPRYFNCFPCQVFDSLFFYLSLF